MSDGEIRVDLGLGMSEAQAEIVRLTKSIESLQANFAHTQEMVERSIKQVVQNTARVTIKATGDMTKAMEAAEKRYFENALRQQRKLQAVLGIQSRGGITGQVQAAAAKANLADTLNTPRFLESKLVDQVTNAHARLFRTTLSAVQARLRLEESRAREMIERSSAQFLAAQSSLATRQRQRIMDLAGNAELLAAQDALRRTTDRRTVERANPALLAAQGALSARSDRRTIDYAGNTALLAAQDTLRSNANRQTIARSDPTLLAARDVLAERARGNTLFEAQRGHAAMSFARTQERLDLNGGADFSGLLGRIAIQGTAVAGLFSALRGAKDFVVDLDAEFHQFQAIAAATNTEMGTLKTRLIEVAQSTKFTTLEVTKAATVLAQAGLSAKQVGDAIGAVTLLATASGSDLGTAVDVVTSALSIWNLETSQAENVANTLTAALNRSKLTIDKITLGYQYAGNAAAALGLTYQELTATLGALANSGIRSGSTLGTGLRQLLIDLQEPSKAMISTLETMGLSLEDINVQNRGFLNVLSTLKTAGFGTADAFKVFEVRAAAAFSALANNIDVAYDLERNFTLSSAAVEANAIQMESLSNTFSNLQSVLYTTIYTAFEPFTRVLQKIASGAIGVISNLGEIEWLAKGVGLAFVAIGTGAALRVMSALFRSVSLMIPPLTAVRAGVNATTGALVAQAGAATAAARGWGALSLAMRANPFINLATILLTVGTAIYSITRNSESAASRLDELTGKVNELQGESDAVTSHITSIDEAIEGLVRQKDALDKSPLMREARMMELIQQFKELGLEISASTSSVDDLIGALQRLKDIDFSKQAVNFQDVVTATREQLEEQREQFGSMTGGGVLGSTPFFQQALGTLVGDPRVGRRFTPADGSAKDQGAWMIRHILGGIVPASREVLPQMLTGEGEFPAFTRTGGILSLMKEALDQRQRIENPDATTKTDIALLTAAIEQLTKIYNQQVSIASSESNLEMARRNAAEFGFKAEGGYGSAVRQIDELRASAGSRQSEILRGRDPTARAEALRQLEAETQKQIDEIISAANALADGYQSQHPEMDADAIKGVVDELKGRSAELMHLLATDVEKATGASLKVLEKERKKNEKVLTEKLKRAVADRDAALTQDSVETAQKGVAALFEEQVKLTNEWFDARSKDTSLDSDAVLALEEEREAALDAIVNDRVEQERKTQEQLNKIAQEALKQREEAVKVQIDQIKDQMALATDALKRANTLGAIEKLVEKINAFAQELNLLGQEAAGLEIQRGSIGSGTVTPVNATVSRKAAILMQLLTSNGYSVVQAAGLVGNLIAESNLDSRAVGDSGKAIGIAQWNDRQPALKAFATRQGRDYLDFDTQSQFLLHELRTTETGPAAQLRRARTTEEATMAGMAFERPKVWGERFGNPDAYHAELGRRVGYADLFSTADPGMLGNTPAVQKANAEADEARKDVIERNAVNAANAAVKAAEEQATRVTGEIAAGTAKSIDEVLSRYAASRANALAAELDKYDAQNIKEGEADPEGVKAARQDLIERFNDSTAKEMLGLLDTYYEQLEQATNDPVAEAQAKLAAAQRPENARRYLPSEVTALEQGVTAAQDQQRAQQIQIIGQQIADITEMTRQENLSAANMNALLERRAQLERELAELKGVQAANTEAAQRSERSLGEVIRDQVQQWQIRNGMMTEEGDVISQNEQAGTAFGQMLDGVASASSNFFTSFTSDISNAGDAVRNFGLSIVQMLQDIIAQAMARQIIKAAAGALGGSGGPLGDILGMVTGTATGAANGTIVPGGAPYRDRKLYKLMPGEAVLNRSAVKAIGEENISKMNGLGNRRLSEGSIALPEQQSNGGGEVNVWVVSPDQVPPLGPNDVVAAVADNINRRGSIRHLIKQVQMGSV